MSRPVVLFSSGGKDSMAALDALRGDPDWTVTTLLTTFTDTDRRVSLHGTGIDLVAAQAAALGLEFVEVGLPPGCDNDTWTKGVAQALEPARRAGIGHVAFGDLRLGDIRRWREQQFRRLELETVFPLWGQDTAELARTVVRRGFKAVVCGLDRDQLDAGFLGRSFDRQFLDELPGTVDPCGENGEFHTFVHDGPGFARPVRFERRGISVRMNRFCMLDLRPA